MCGDCQTDQSVVLVCRLATAEFENNNEISVRSSMRATAWRELGLNARLSVRCRVFVVVTCFFLFPRKLHFLLSVQKRSIQILRFLGQVMDTASVHCDGSVIL